MTDKKTLLNRLLAVVLSLVLVFSSANLVWIFANQEQETTQTEEGQTSEADAQDEGEAIDENTDEENGEDIDGEADEDIDSEEGQDLDPDQQDETDENDETAENNETDGDEAQPDDDQQFGIIIIPGGVAPADMDVQQIIIPTEFKMDLRLKTLRALAPDVFWTDGTPQLPLGSVHDFGVLTFGNFTSTYSGWGSGAVHMESGVAVAGNLELYNSYGDFGQAHDHVGNTTIRPHNPRLLVGGNFVETGRPGYSSLILHGGDILMTMGANIDLEFEMMETSAGRHTPDADGDWTSVPYGDPAVVSNFFTSARHYLNYLNNFFATVTRYDEYGIFRGRIIPPSNPWGQPTVELPSNMANYSLIILDLDASSGTVSAPFFRFPAEFTGNYVININNDGPVRIGSDTSITSPLGLTDIHQVGRHYSHRIIWNFTGSGSITTDYSTIIGSVLAPNADFYGMYGGSVKGALIVNNFYHGASGFEVHTPTDPNNP
ncbi:MAG: choice-of-anchor A family protein, partial [Defluviitaleaceae bacterium]|nr:choice-of-anchor A family protein [Defluviitaleaceae bacterium]